jgi:hypothetical protein
MGEGTPSWEPGLVSCAGLEASGTSPGLLSPGSVSMFLLRGCRKMLSARVTTAQSIRRARHTNSQSKRGHMRVGEIAREERSLLYDYQETS